MIVFSLFQPIFLKAYFCLLHLRMFSCVSCRIILQALWSELNDLLNSFTSERLITLLGFLMRKISN